MSSYTPLTRDNTADYLRRQGWLAADETVAVEPLTGGVSNEVLYVSRPERVGEDYVVKQALPQLRTPQPWFSSVERIWREVEVLRICQELLDAAGSEAGLARTPRILHEDRANYTFAMTAAPREHRVWKTDLLAGVVDPAVAEQCGRLLGLLHAGSWESASVRERIGDRRLFDELRLDPYYRTVAAALPADAPLFARLIASAWDHPRSLVHADFTPKNLLVWPQGLMMVDFETGHYGDPAFDLGLFLAHLVLKAMYLVEPGISPNEGPYLELARRFWETYRATLGRDALGGPVPDDECQALESRAVAQLAGCVWARLDGKSCVNYLTDPHRRDLLRSWCRDMLIDNVSTLPAAFARLPIV